MVDFGALDGHLEGDGITFTYKGEAYSIDPTAEDMLKILAFNAKLNAGELEDFNPTFGVYATVAPLFGSKCDPKTGRFTGGIIAKLLKAGITFKELDTLLSATWLKFTQGDDLAKALVETGDPKDAYAKVLEDREKANRATPEELGETNGTV